MISERPRPAAAPHRSIARSLALKERATRRIPTLAQTFSKAPTQFVQGVAPVYLARGAGSHVWDVDGNEYIDYPMALGPVILGHNERAVTEAAIAQLQRGIAFSLPHPLEVELSELLGELIPAAEMVRFGKNGSDVTSGAVRAARAATGRDLIACCGYHGWQDWFIGTTTRSRGVPRAVRELTKTFAYNDLDSLERIFAAHPGEVAAVILEPVGVVEPVPGFLEGVRDLAHRNGALLIFDEVVTGFRLDLGGAQRRYGVTPDLACFGKAMGNGFPIAAVVGSAAIMPVFDEIFFSFTFGGDALSLAASIATIRFMQEEPVIPHLWAQGAALQRGYNALAAELGIAHLTECVGLPPRTVVTFRDEQGNESLVFKTLVQQECLKRGVLFSGSHNLCYRHSDEDIAQTLEVYRTALTILAEAVDRGDALERLEGPVVEPVFRRA
jgi:glutamate-1-semialdehyde aminotransferase